MNAFDLAAGRAWAMSESELMTVMQIAAREGEGPEAVAMKLGRPLDNTRTVDVRDGVAIVPLVGPMFRRANMLTEISGATSTEVFAQDFRAALDNPDIRGIVLDMSSPGGEASGVNEVANAIFEARGIKPVVSYVSDMAASGAYWIASAADRIVMDATASVGSIGVVTRYVKHPDRPGVRVTEIVSSQSPNKRMDPESDAGRAEIQRHVDSMAQVFVDSVARNRSATVASVLERFGRGGMEVGAHAVRLGMADALGSLESVIAEMSGRLRPFIVRDFNNLKGTVAMATENPTVATGIDPATITAALISSQFPAVADALRAEGTQAGAVIERARILAIQDASLPGFENVATASIEAGHTAETFALAQAKAQKAAGPAFLAALRSDERALPAIRPDAAPAAKSEGIDRSLPLDDQIKAEWAASSVVRDEFMCNFASYSAFREAEAAGRVKILRKG
jgi:signal peptide peptidase SppA